MTTSETLHLEDVQSETERLAARLSEASRELLELRERLRMVGSSAKVGIWEYDFRTDRLWVSDELAAMYGYTPEELTWEKFVSCLHPDDVVTELKRPTPSFPFGEVNEFIFRFRHADGDFRTIRSRSTTYGSGDTPYRKMGAHIDMSSDTLLHLNSKLAEANERISQFSRIASHDLRSPLRAINSLALLTLHDPDSTLSPTAVQQLERVVNRIGHMDRLVCELLDYSTADLDKAAPTETDFKRLLDSIVDLVDSGDLTLEVDSTVGRVSTTASPLTICVRNLVDNACKHHDRTDGTVRLTARVDGRWLEIVVNDDGPGIAEAHQKKIFEPFYSTNSENGTGLGLAHVRRVVEQYDGHLDLESAPGKGTTFRLRWPVAGPDTDRRAPVEHRQL
ncbi:MAG: PAS domain-containing sensor histidine kinase [Acidimicrobiia bacterium]|nr:PAS domain-containing sensor histidine kinase [Acidimicrobiia bacterium]